jgi:hypothetical protein
MIDINIIVILLVINTIAVTILYSIIKTLKDQISQLTQFNREQIILNRHLVANITKILNNEQVVQIPYYGEFGEA